VERKGYREDWEVGSKGIGQSEVRRDAQSNRS
jgi:hypothetical protein